MLILADWREKPTAVTVVLEQPVVAWNWDSRLIMYMAFR